MLKKKLVALLILAFNCCSSKALQHDLKPTKYGPLPQADLKTDMTWITEAVNRHNFYRAKHGVGDLKLSKELSQFSQYWANQLESKKRTLQDRYSPHSGEEGLGKTLGENIALQGGSGPLTVSGSSVVDAWYKEVENYDFDKGSAKGTAVAGHFTQVVWKGSTEIGIAMTCYKVQGEYANVCVEVANYFPPGNDGQYKANVFPEKNAGGNSNSQCRLYNTPNIPSIYLILVISTKLCLGLWQL